MSSSSEDASGPAPTTPRGLVFLIGAVGLPVLALLHLQPNDSDRAIMRIYAPWVLPAAAIADAVATGRPVGAIAWGGRMITLGQTSPQARAASIRSKLPFFDLRAESAASCLARF